jgi:acetyl esterase/lipase
MGVKVFCAKSLVAISMLVNATNFCCDSSSAQPKNIEPVKEICYSTIGKPLYLDLLRPPINAGPLPVIICIHGGGWGAGSRHEMLELALGLTKCGFCAACIDYRLAPASRFPAAVVDVKTALNYLREHSSELNIDPRRIGVVGGSAGGHLALLMATTSADIRQLRASSPTAPCPVKAVVSISGPTDLAAELPKNSELVVENFLGKKRAEAYDLWKQASPINYVTRYAAPMLVIQGDADEIVPYNQAVSFVSACKKAGASAELITLHNRSHGAGGDPNESAASVRALVEFLIKNVK